MLQTKHNEDELSAEEVRALLHEIAEQAQIGRMALDSMSERDTVQGLIGIRNLLVSISDRLFEVAGGGTTFDRLSELEDGHLAKKAVAS